MSWFSGLFADSEENAAGNPSTLTPTGSVQAAGDARISPERRSVPSSEGNYAKSNISSSVRSSYTSAVLLEERGNEARQIQSNDTATATTEDESEVRQGTPSLIDFTNLPSLFCYLSVPADI